MNDPKLKLIVARAVRCAGGMRALGRALNISYQSIQSWQKIPAERVVEVEDATNIPRERLRPDLFRRDQHINQQDRADDLEDALLEIVEWSEAYPLAVFPEPDLKKARALLEAGGITLDSISAHCVRHVIEGVGKIAREALEQ